MLILILSICNSLVIPLDEAFSPEFLKYPIILILRGFIDLAFTIDIVFGFITSVVNLKGVISYDSAEIW